MANNPMPYSGAERRAGLAAGPRVNYLSGNADLLPVVLSEGRELLAPADDVPVVRIGGPQLRQADDGPAFSETKTPQRAPSRESDLIVPFGQAVITSLMVGAAAALLAWAFGWAWRVVAVAVAVALIGSWFWRLRLVDSLLWTVERVTGRDMNNDNQIGRPAATSFAVVNPGAARGAVAAENRQAAQSAERVALLAFVDQCYISGCGEHAHGVRASGPARAEYVARRDTLLSLGVAAWRFPNNPRGGWQMAVSRQRARQIVEKHVL